MRLCLLRHCAPCYYFAAFDYAAFLYCRFFATCCHAAIFAADYAFSFFRLFFFHYIAAIFFVDADAAMLAAASSA